MDLSTIEIPKQEARRQFEAYRRAARDRHSAEDLAIAKGYQALAEGTPVIQLTPTIAAGGVAKLEAPRGQSWRKSATVPRLAVARADARFAWTHGVTRAGGLTIAGKREHHWHNKRDLRVFPAGTLEQLEGTEAGWGRSYDLNAMVPIVPPPMRPADKLGNYHVLWEADWNWAPGPPPGDPALLKHIGGDLYAVHAVWDLTELERAVLAGRGFDE